MNERLLGDIRWLTHQIRTDGPAYRGTSPRGREEMVRKLVNLVYELDENLKYNRGELPRDWRGK